MTPSLAGRQEEHVARLDKTLLLRGRDGMLQRAKAVAVRKSGVTPAAPLPGAT
jgi:hypothetical protein